MGSDMPVSSLCVCFAMRIVACLALTAASQAATSQTPSEQAAPRCSQRCPGTPDMPVLVIGGGISGVTAASELQSMGCSVKLLEAKSHLGGRMHGEVVQDGGWTFNHGANWIHGGHPNPIWDLNEEYNLVRTQWLPRSYYSRTEDGVTREYGNDTYVPGQKMRNSFDDFANAHQHFKQWLSLACRGEFNSLDLPLTYFLNEYLQFANMSHMTLDKFLLFFGVYETLDLAVDLFSASMINQFGRAYSLDKEHMVADPYSTIVDFLARGLDVVLNEPVQTIEYAADGVLVTSRTGQSYRGSLVIVTVPVGVLKTSDLTFHPPLPPWKQRVINGMNMGLLEKMAFEFDEPWWEMAGSTEDAFWTLKHGQRNGFKNTASEWYNLHNLLNKTVPPVLLVTPGGYFADLLEYQSDAEVIEIFRKELENIFPGTTVPEPRRFLRTFHRLDEFMRGSYFSPSVGTDPLSMNFLAEPVANRVLFAGEATHTVRFGYVDGAYDTGRRVVQQALALCAHDGTLPFSTAGLETTTPPDEARIRAQWRAEVENVLQIKIPDCNTSKQSELFVL